MIGPPELVVVGIIALLIFGPKQLPKLARGAGEAIKELRGIRKEIDQEVDEITDAVDGAAEAIDRVGDE